MCQMQLIYKLLLLTSNKIDHLNLSERVLGRTEKKNLKAFQKAPKTIVRDLFSLALFLNEE